MSDFISIIMIIIFACFAAKKLIIPHIIAKKAAKAALSDATPIVTDVKEKDAAARIVSAFERRPVTFIDVREEWLCLAEDEDPMTGDTFAQRVEKTANEMLLNASLRGRNVQFGTINAGRYVILYTTYTT